MNALFGGSKGSDDNNNDNNNNNNNNDNNNDNGVNDSQVTGTIPTTQVMAKPASMLSKARAFVDDQRKTLAPWTEFAATPSNPKTLAEATKRVMHNVSKFRSNYIVVTMILAAYALITSPMLLFSIMLVYAGLAFASMRAEAGPVIIFGKEYTSQDLTRATLILAVPLLYFSSATSTLFWLIGASLFVILAHAAVVAVPAPEQLQQSA
ncbi:hypothetical protein PTSG_09315 [Salpingoeca rosetta]|uniref:PRA1 family protein n=1 Tax=Salpingoeca rosetta (strain ATCC 50818 / BSB-021) TaxID=946362 RepID=F2UMA1_SALR5|nr:uncharacterized protein PTSG_09315 [Salpingoeca rosetta]EGD78250.1 hypothetical protein PTSG_09315 [Salpingoeca rosetta]|eukprot:XP_004989573.1 hypothetical protein PTSG_09315 [Salpingoeca rosetta]